MQGLWIYPEDTEVLGVACKSLLKALKPHYQKIALFSPIDGGCEGLNPLEFHSAIDKQKALELASTSQEKLLSFRLKHHFSQALKRSYGSSAAAIQNGKSVDTSMGLTPLEGLIMGTRCGDIDPTVVEYTAQCANKSLEEVMKMLNHESGLKGICGDNEKHRSQKRKRRQASQTRF